MLVRKIRYLILLAGLIVFQSCTKTVSVEIPETEEKIVVEGYIENGTAPFVIVSRSLPFFGTISYTEFESLTIPGAIVTVTNENVTDTLVPLLPGYGIYISPNIIGEAGETYSLRVEA